MLYCSIKDDCNLTQSETIQSQKDQPLRLDLNGLNAFIEDSQTTGYKKKKKRNGERGVKKHFLVFVERENCHCQFITTKRPKEENEFLVSWERESLFLTKYLSLYQLRTFQKKIMMFLCAAVCGAILLWWFWSYLPF